MPLDLPIVDDTGDYGTLKLEHSLIAIEDWEAIFHRSFLSSQDKSAGEMLEYIRCMTINKNVNPDIYLHLTPDSIEKIKNYIADKHTATSFSKNWYDELLEKEKAPSGKKEEIITAELVYYWMIANNIPIEFRKWHIERLLTLIRVCAIKNQPPDKKGNKRAKLTSAEQQTMLAKRNMLNAERRAKLGTKG